MFISGYGALPYLAIQSYQSFDMIVKNQMLRVEQEVGMKVENQFKIQYLMVIPFFAIAFLLFVIFVRFDTITHYVHRA